MSKVPYHLRTNKAADRFALIEAIKYLPKLRYGDLDSYTYYGFGGPYLEDMRLMYEFCPEIRMVSIEEKPWIHERQKFHRPCGDKHLSIENCVARTFIARYRANDKKSIFWLDYTDLDYKNFEDFMTLLGKVTQGSMIKITLRANPDDFSDSIEKENEINKDFRDDFENVLPSSFKKLPWRHEDFAFLIQEMIQIASQKAFHAKRFLFYPVSSFYYTDTGIWMLTLTGIIWPRNDPATVRKAYNTWRFANLMWGKPTLIDIPELSTQERLQLQNHLPDSSIRGKTLREKLGHLIDENQRITEIKLEQYAAFHRYFPYFLRGIP